jgi:hypothetical protein
VDLMGGDTAAMTAALVAAQREMTNAVKDGKNPHFKSEYATLASVLNAVRDPLLKHGIAMSQHPTTEGNTVSVRTLLMHTSGGWLSSACSATAKNNDPQSVGSAISYLRRYSLAAVCGIAQEDDDGSAASSSAPQQHASRPAGGGGKASEKQLEFADKLIRSSVFTEEEFQRVTRKCATGDKATVSAAIEWMQEQIAERKALKAVGA